MSDQIDASTYVFRRSVLETMPTGRPVEVEQENFPGLLAEGAKVIGYVDRSYWRDLGDAGDFVAGSADMVRGSPRRPPSEDRLAKHWSCPMRRSVSTRSCPAVRRWRPAALSRRAASVDGVTLRRCPAGPGCGRGPRDRRAIDERRRRKPWSTP